MRVVMLKEYGLTIQTESRFEEEWLEKIIEALKIQAYSVHTDTNEHGQGFLTIQPNCPPKTK